MKEIIINKVYTTKEIADILKVNIKTVHKLIKNNELKAIKLGKGYKTLGGNILDLLRLS